MAASNPASTSSFPGANYGKDSNAGTSVIELRDGAGLLREGEVDNRNNSIPTVLKVYDSLAAGVTLGVTVPVLILTFPAGAKLPFKCKITIATGVSYAVVTTGGTGGTAALPNPVGVKLASTDA